MEKKTKKIIIGVSVGLAVIGSLFGIAAIVKKIREKNNSDGSSSGTTGSATSTSSIKVGDTLYPSGTTVNIRSTPEINDNYFKMIDPVMLTANAIKYDHTGIIGTVLEIVSGKTDGLTWYKVQLNTPITVVANTYKTGYVRATNVKKG